MMPFFSEAVHYLEEIHGPFEAVIGHSLGGMASLKAVKEGLEIKKLVIIGTGDSVTDITEDFARNMKLNGKVAERMRKYLDGKFNANMEDLSGAVSAREVKVPTLVIHDKDDVDVPVDAAHAIKEQLEHGEIYITENLGHRRILGNGKVIAKIKTFLTE